MYSKGFTLIEVLVALIIIAVALMAITWSIDDSTRNEWHLKSNYAAYLLADNLAAEFSLSQSSIQRQGLENMLGIDLNYHIIDAGDEGKIINVADGNDHKIALKVFDDDS